MSTVFSDHLLTGDHASRPAANAVPQGTLYSCTDHGIIYKSDGVATWSDWATIAGSVPGVHATSHEDGGGDEISVAGLSGLLADDQNPTAHAADHQNGGGDEISVAGLSGLLADGQTPLAHAASHETGGSDPIDLTDQFAELTGATFVGDVIVPDEAYDATNWDGSFEVPTKNAVRDKIEAMGGGYTDEQAQDAVGAMVDGTTLEYVDATPLLRVKAGGVGANELASTTVTPGTYGDASNSPQITIDADGRVTAATDVPITGGSSGLPYMYPKADAIDDIVNDNFRGAALDTGGTRFSGASGWSWLNQGSATASVDAEGNLWLTSPSSASFEMRGIYVPVPSGTWRIRARVQFRNGTSSQAVVGMFLRDSGSGKIEWHGIGFSGGAPVLWQAKLTNASSFSGSRGFPSLASYPNAATPIFPPYLEIEDDGTSYYLRAGFDDGPARLILSKFSRTDFLTSAADQIGLFSLNDSSVATVLICSGFYRAAVSQNLSE